ncbi:MAG: glycerophosphodiester phosphodiesterase [Candidatus Bathyarchaeota archaeon B26-2]|nr:MAG: glycerophosphodiester phosphodiesterase [Candidatus Bathyarchaeota archaeon B26-2]
MIEFDVRVSKDGELVVMHDPTVDRTTNGRGRVDKLTLRELKRLDAGMGETVPTFSEVIEELGGKIGMNIHMYAYGEALDRAVEACMEADILDEVFFAFSDPAEIRRLLRQRPEVYVCSGYRAAEEDYLEASRELGAKILQPPIGASYLKAEWVEKVHEKGMVVEVFWADTVEDMLRLRSLGVDGILTNFPDIFIETFRRERTQG